MVRHISGEISQETIFIRRDETLLAIGNVYIHNCVIFIEDFYNRKQPAFDFNNFGGEMKCNTFEPFLHYAN